MNAACQLLSCVLDGVPAADAETSETFWLELDAGVPLFVQRVDSTEPLPDVGFGIRVTDLHAVVEAADRRSEVTCSDAFVVAPGVRGVNLSAPGTPGLFVHT